MMRGERTFSTTGQPTSSAVASASSTVRAMRWGATGMPYASSTVITSVSDSFSRCSSRAFATIRSTQARFTSKVRTWPSGRCCQTACRCIATSARTADSGKR